MASSDSERLLTADEMKKAGSLQVYTSDGSKMTAEEMLRSTTPSQSVVLIALRHFHCGLCQDYATQITSKITPDVLRSHNARLVFLGCGSYQLIKSYAELVGADPQSFFSDPSAELYTALGMVYRNLTRDPSNTSVDTASGPMKSVVAAAKRLWTWGFHSSGPIKQNGGEMLFVDGQNVKLAHRMLTTNGHMPVDELVKVIGLE